MLAHRLAPVLARVRARRGGLGIGAWDGAETLTWSTGELPDGASSIFEIGSITKVFTATLLADMAREGIVAVDDPVSRHLPGITLEDLACHRSGLPRLPKGLLWPALTRDRHDPYARVDGAWLERATARTAPRRAPGRRVAYSNYGAGLLGYTLAQRAGRPYGELVRERICEPLGMTDTGTAVDGGRLAQGHSSLGRPVGHWHFDALAGAGGLRSTVADLLAFLRLQTGEPHGPLADAARETQVERAHRGSVGFGLGWMRVPAGRRVPVELLFHDGGTGGFRSAAAVAPEARVAVVLLSSRVRRLTGIGLRLLRALA